MQTIYLDISNKGVISTIYAKQGDVGRKFEVFLTDSGFPYVPASGSAFSVWYSGASGEGNYTDIGDKSSFSVNGNKVAVEMISQMLLNDGDGVLSLALNDPNGNQISTWNIPYVCESVPGANSEEAKSYYTAFSKAVEGLPYPDTSLSVHGKAADAAAVGTALAGKASAGSVWTATDPNNDGNIVLQYGGNVVPGGSGGSGGTPGADGFSPIATVVPTEDGALITITDKNGTTEVTVPNGKDGADGKSAYQYAQDGGFEGTEEEFAAKLAATDSDTELVLSDNLLDKSLLTKGGVWYYGSSGIQLAGNADSYSYYGFIPLRGAGTYRTKFQAKVHESTYKRIALVDDNNNFVTNVTGSHGEIPSGANDQTRNWLDFEFVVTQANIDAGATKVAFDVYSLYMEQTMIVKDREYPSEYIPYGYIEVTTDKGKKQDNVLCEKTAVFLGDSICAGTTVGTDSPYYNYGWGGIIGEANRMNWTNYGKNGGTITHRGADGTCIAKIADTAIAEHPNADYVIFEGGCNDADQMKEAGLGEISTDYATFDTTTFSGALESMILKLVNAYPNAKIGYIIPQKMYTGYSDFTAANHIHRKYFERALEICKKWGIPFVDIWEGTPLNPKLPTASIYYSDGIQHLTLTGYQRITPMIEAFMRSL